MLWLLAPMLWLFAAEIQGLPACLLLKDLTEILGGTVAGLPGDLVDPEVGVFEQIHRPGDPGVDQKIIYGLAGFFFEQDTQPAGA